MSAITYEEVLTLFRETDRRFKETERLLKEQSMETDQRFKETDRLLKEQSMEADRRMKETDRQLSGLGQQIGGLGEKFGYFTEGLALPSMERILAERFGMTFILPRAQIRKNGKTMEIDVLAYANDDINLVIAVEVKSRVKMGAIKQLRKLITRFRELSPEHRDKGMIGILTGVHWEREVAEKARKVGFLTASIQDGIFEITTPEDFEARGW
uniref:DUF8196 domain-containing protein n=1 Tax=Candidatus Kentrum sp. UNK TaxID=2126344 RepID=A0A451AKB7_9GAMM|nr:MAG: hypothetical protein BECKUNK1418G_GA0071005_109515 [Candidatus Kentron sp. UNK]VFK71693.1 MAG: hypothetical protein BECKUNK1418H_GA0071006_107818 [Candidatus Kentron sp. UNK]